MRITWTGYGIIVFLLYICTCFGGIYVGRTISDVRVGSGFIGASIGLMAGASVVYLLGMLLNRRRSADGRWRWVDRHKFQNWPVQKHWIVFAVLALALAPCGTAGFVPQPVTVGLTVATAVLLVVGGAMLSTRPHRHDSSASPAAGRVPATDDQEFDL
jgi:membrane protein YqaA with SNARE-associated domain